MFVPPVKPQNTRGTSSSAERELLFISLVAEYYTARQRTKGAAVARAYSRRWGRHLPGTNYDHGPEIVHDGVMLIPPKSH